MNLHHVRYFLAVADTGSFTKGAERCFVSQPTLSAAIAKLERELDATLFDRGRRATLTPAGIRFHDRARVIAYECDAAKAEFRQAAPRQTLQLGVLRSIAGGPVARLLADFTAAHGDVAPELVDGTAEELSTWLRQGRLDAALTSLAERDGGEGEHAVALFRDRLQLAISERHRLAPRTSLRLGDLEGEPFILRDHCEMHNQARRLFAEHRVRPRIVYRTDQDGWTLDLVAAGLGHAVMSSSFSAPGVTFLPITDLDISRRVGLVWRVSRESEAIERLSAFAAGHDWRGGPSRPGEPRARQAWAY